MSEPVSGIAFDSMKDQVYPKAPFTEQKFMVRAVLPEHTFLEKIFLLHEAFAKSKNLIGVERRRIKCVIVETTQTYECAAMFHYLTVKLCIIDGTPGD